MSGKILSDGADWTHFMVPMEYEPSRHCYTSLGWQDPRGLDDGGQPLLDLPDRVPIDNAAARALEEREGELMWPERFGPTEVAALKTGLGPYMASGRLQQSPRPKAGGIFHRDWWQLYEPEDGKKFPAMEFIVASLDSAYTEKEENDPSGLTVWGVFRDKDDHRRIMLINAWRKHLQFSADRSKIERGANESEARWHQRTREHWGLLEWVTHSCLRWKVNVLLIEAKASGISAAQEIRNRFGYNGFGVILKKVTGDKYSRALAVQPAFSQGLIYAPARDWSEMVIDEMAVFPKGKYKDLTNSATQAIKHLRDIGLAQTDDEVHLAEAGFVTPRARPKAIYPV